MVEIDLEDLVPYDELVEQTKNKDSIWYAKEDPGMIVVNEEFLKRANCDDSFCAFKLIGVRP